jgi:hypothetical protein
MSTCDCEEICSAESMHVSNKCCAAKSNWYAAASPRYSK